jgi:trimeric autotransporter adhesin
MNLFRLKNSNYTNRKFSGRALLLVALMFTCFAISPMVQALNPPPDGGYPGGNTAEGTDALNSILILSSHGGEVGALRNTAIGYQTLFSDIVGGDDTATGYQALKQNTASFNSAFGGLALYSNTIGTQNSAVGWGALRENIAGSANTAVGYNALTNNLGNDSSDSSQNTAVGSEALYNNTSGFGNTAIGYRALDANTYGIYNIALGWGAGHNITGSYNIDIGSSGVADDNFTIRIGQDDFGVGPPTHIFIAPIKREEQTFSAGVNNYVTVRMSDGRLGYTAVVSSRRYKDDIKPLDKTSEALYSLKPVSFRLKKEFDPTQALGFGLIAEEVEKVDPALVYRNEKGEVESVRYEMVNAMLLNEFLKEHQKNEEQEATIARQQKQIEALTTGLQNVSAQLKLTKPTPQIVVNDR